MAIQIPEAIKQRLEKNPNACGIKDATSVFRYANDHYARIMGFKHSKDIFGRTDFDMPCGTTHCAPLFRAQDQEVLKSQKKMRILDIHPFSGGEWKAYIFTKTPYFTPEGDLGGTFFHGEECTHSSILELGSLLAKTSIDSGTNPLLGQNSYLLGSIPTSIMLSPRQKEILFFLIRGHSLKHIAATLNVTISTVSEHVEKLKGKFNALTKNNLIEKAVTQGFLSLIPDGLSIKQMSLALREI
jgi:DNA-binding CsgD family transcriptional regulator